MTIYNKKNNNSDSNCEKKELPYLSTHTTLLSLL